MAQQVRECKLVGLTLHEVEEGREWDVVALHEGQSEAEVIGSAFRAESGRLAFQSEDDWAQYPSTLRRIADILEAKERELGLRRDPVGTIGIMQAPRLIGTGL